MLRRLWTLAFASWAFVGMPYLCTAGILTHPCPPEESRQPVQHSHDEDDNGCHHESDCAQDPCSELSIRNDRDDSQTVTSESVPIAREFLLLDDLMEHIRPVGAIPRLVLRLPHLPCPESVLPLLI